MKRIAKEILKKLQPRGGRDSRTSRPSVTPAPALTPESDDTRLRRLAEWSLCGQRAAAELELHEWNRQPDCPVAARFLYATMLAMCEDFVTARAVLKSLTDHDADLSQTLLQMHIALRLLADQPESADRLIHLLHAEFGHRTEIQAWLKSLNLSPHPALPIVPQTRIDRLALDLIAQPQVIASLAAAQAVSCDPTTIALLRPALILAARELLDTPHGLVICQAIAELSLLIGDADEARRWAHRGLKMQPLSASLALVLARVEDDAHVGPPALAILEHVHDAHPEYPDVRSALIRRQIAQGQTQTARLRIEQWIHQQPDHPIAQQLRRELAA